VEITRRGFGSLKIDARGGLLRHERGKHDREFHEQE